ncbi:MAG: hypothetical protein V1772_05510, partial [Chloroflexota bacterium]
PVGAADWRPLALVPWREFYLWDTRDWPDGQYTLGLDASVEGQSVATGIRVPVEVANGHSVLPAVRMVAPRGGERWAGLHEIRWEAWGASEPLTATVSLSADGGKRWQTLAQVDARGWRYLWDTRAQRPGPRYQVRVTVADARGLSTVDTSAQFALAHSAGYPPHVLFLSPDTEGRLNHDGVAWAAEDADGDPLRVALAMSHGPGGAWRELASDLPARGDYELLVPPDAGAQDRLRLQVTDGAWRIETVSPALQSGAPSGQASRVQWRAPIAGQVWSGANTVRWGVADPLRGALRASLQVSGDGGLSWRPLAQDLAPDDLYLWDTRQVPNGTYRLRLTLADAHRRLAVLGDPFSVRNEGLAPPRAMLVAPRGRDVWSGLQQLAWQVQTDPGARRPAAQDVAYSLDRGRSWLPVARGLTNQSHFVWDTSTVPNSEEVWLRLGVGEGLFRREALSADALAVRNLFAPMVRLLVPPGSLRWQGQQPIAWRAVHALGADVTVQLDLSLDGGRSWRALAADLPAEGSYVWDTTTVPEGSRALVRARAVNGRGSGVDTRWAPILIAGNAPMPRLPLYVR